MMSKGKFASALVAVLLGPPSAATAGEWVVTMAGATYSPAKVSAKVGDTLRFVNDDQTDHNVFVPTVGFGVDLGKQEPGKETLLPLGKAGTFEAECVFHSEMLLTVEVAP